MLFIPIRVPETCTAVWKAVQKRENDVHGQFWGQKSSGHRVRRRREKNMARHGENIRKRKDGRWEGRYKTLNKEKGRTVYRSVYGSSYGEVREKLFSVKNNIQETTEENGKAPCQLLFSQAAKEWLEEISDNRKYSTYVKYETIYRLHLAKTAGTCSISLAGVQEMQKKLSEYLFEKELSESLLKSIYCVAGQIFDFADKKYRTGIFMPGGLSVKSKNRNVKTLSGVEQARLLLNIRNDCADKCKLAVLLCLYTGLRLGELCALRWKDIDFASMTLTVKRTVQRIAAQEYGAGSILLETAPKTESSSRTVPLAEEPMKYLSCLKRADKYVFGGEKVMEPRTMQYRFKKILKEAEIANINFHALRHTFATNCVENGMDIKSLSEILGHSDVKMTLNRYVHPTMDSKRRQIGELSGFYGRIQGQTA